MNRNEEVKHILRSREIAEEQRRVQRAAVAKRTKPMPLDYGFVRNATFPKSY